MTMEKLILGPYDTNGYLLEEKNKALIIDPAAEPVKIFSALSTPNLTAIILTHAHSDHLGALSALKNEFPKARFLIHPKELPLLKGRFEPDGFLQKGRLEIGPPAGGWQLEIFHTPGHTPGSICLLAENFLFTGDTLFAKGCGRTDLPYSNRRNLVSSLKQLAKLPPSLTIYPGHGESSTLGQALAPLPKLVPGF